MCTLLNCELDKVKIRLLYKLLYPTLINSDSPRDSLELASICRLFISSKLMSIIINQWLPFTRQDSPHHLPIPLQLHELFLLLFQVSIPLNLLLCRVWGSYPRYYYLCQDGEYSQQHMSKFCTG
jgi:hypothetical protein